MIHLHFAWEIFFRKFADFFGFCRINCISKYFCRIVCISKYFFFLISCRNLLFYQSKNYLYILDKATLLHNFNYNIQALMPACALCCIANICFFFRFILFSPGNFSFLSFSISLYILFIWRFRLQFSP